TGRNEVLVGGYWLPAPSFAANPETCATQADAVLAENRIGFLSGSARLDAQARQAINALAGVVRHCVQNASLRAEIGGHTDSVGSEEGNLALSLARAESVRNALAARGIDPAALQAQGYGASEPIADNTTDEGRAANRRTTVRWIQ
ncbi:MAG: OmpA family protein, partial [Paracoccaceae bacterium]